MERILTLTDKQIEDLNNAINKKIKFRKLTGIKLDSKYNVGDTAVSIDNVVQNGVYKSHFANTVIYYVVLKVMDINLGFAYSFYQTN